MVVTGSTGGSFISTTDIVVGTGNTATTVAHTTITTVANTPTDPTTCVDFMHLATNMLAFYGFARSIVETEGPGDTISIYLTCAVVSSWLAGVAGALHPAFRIVRNSIDWSRY